MSSSLVGMDSEDVRTARCCSSPRRLVVRLAMANRGRQTPPRARARWRDREVLTATAGEWRRSCGRRRPRAHHDQTDYRRCRLTGVLSAADAFRQPDLSATIFLRGPRVGPGLRRARRARGHEPRRGGGDARPATARGDGPLAGVERRIRPAGLGEHSRRCSGSPASTVATGLPARPVSGRPPTYVAGRLRAAGYRVTVEEVSVPAFRERSRAAPDRRLALVRGPHAAVLGQRVARGDGSRRRPRLLGRGVRGAAARRGGADRAGHMLVPREGAGGAARRGRGGADRRRRARARLAPAHRRPGTRARRRRERRRAGGRARPRRRRCGQPRSGAHRA